MHQQSSNHKPISHLIHILFNLPAKIIKSSVLIQKHDPITVKSQFDFVKLPSQILHPYRIYLSQYFVCKTIYYQYFTLT